MRRTYRRLIGSMLAAFVCLLSSTPLASPSIVAQGPAPLGQPVELGVWRNTLIQFARGEPAPSWLLLPVPDDDQNVGFDRHPDAKIRGTEFSILGSGGGASVGSVTPVSFGGTGRQRGYRTTVDTVIFHYTVRQTNVSSQAVGIDVRDAHVRVPNWSNVLRPRALWVDGQLRQRVTFNPGETRQIVWEFEVPAGSDARILWLRAEY
ncbi:MAG: hypothetical protein HY329_00595 [Chloroflexi bacterium]|nr:hypothetical protein [Chloroflexota bacterium]